MWSPSVILAVARTPRLWVEAVRAAAAMAPAGWWRRRPFLPIPDRDYLAWRTATAYGSAAAVVDPADVVSYLRWRRRQRVSVA